MLLVITKFVVFLVFSFLENRIWLFIEMSRMTKDFLSGILLVLSVIIRYVCVGGGIEKK